MFSGVVSPAQVIGNQGGGRWEEDWTGAAELREVPRVYSARRERLNPAPLLVLLNGCGQDSASFAECTCRLHEPSAA